MATINVTEQDFEQIIAENKTVLVDFWAEWCPPCKMIAPVLEELDQQIEELTVVKVNADENPNLLQKFQIMSIPTLKLFKNGEEVKTTVGFKPLEELKAWVNA